MNPTLPLLLDPKELEPLLGRPDILLVDLCHPDQYAQAHIPGAIHIPPGQTQLGVPPAPGLLPVPEDLRVIIARLGLREDQSIVVYDDEGGGWAGRMMWLLHSMGHQRVSLLDGGLRAWHAEGLPLTAEPSQASQEASFELQVSPEFSVTREELLALLGSEGFSVWDARSRDEHLGLRQSALQNGHIPGAIHFEWTDAMDAERGFRLKPLPAIKAHLETLGITQDSVVVTHCHSHHRSGLTYAIGKILGLNIRAYPGSWSEWGNHPNSPVER